MDDRRRFCPCGAKLARDNPGKLCSPCYRSSVATEIIGEDSGWLDEVRLNAQAAASIYSRPLDFPSSRHYLAALSDPLDRLCKMFNLQPPSFEALQSSEGVEAGRRSRVGKYAGNGHGKAPSEIRIWGSAS